MKTIIAIGGGSLRTMATLPIDQKIVALTQKKKPNALFIPTASSDDETYWKAFQETYAKKLKCHSEVLYLLREKPTFSEIKNKIQKADLVYVGGGNTLKMMRKWRYLGVDKLLEEAWHQEKILCGLSAGALCWFAYGHSDSMAYYSPENWKYIRVKGLGFIPILACPHYDSATQDLPRKYDFQAMASRFGNKGIAIDDHCALLIQDQNYSLLQSQKGAGVYKIQKNQGKMLESKLPKQGKLQDLLL